MKEQLKTVLPSSFKEELLDRVIQVSTEIHLTKNEQLVSYGQTKRSMFIILEGSLLRKIVTKEGNVKTVMFHTAEFLPIVTCIDSFFLKSQTEYEITANEDTILLETSFDVTNRLIQESHDFAIFSYNYMIQKYFITETFRNNLIAKSPEQFLTWLYEEYPFFFQKFSSASIASFMGITPEWLSKIKRKIIS